MLVTDTFTHRRDIAMYIDQDLNKYLFSVLFDTIHLYNKFLKSSKIFSNHKIATQKDV